MGALNVASPWSLARNHSNADATTARFFSRINYSLANEDSGSELRVLGLQAEDTVLCIAGSGARAFDLLTEQPPRHIFAVDFNPTQIYLTELKAAAIAHLDYHQFITFAGLQSAERGARQATYHALRAQLTAAARAFWDGAPRLIDDGILFCGVWERWLRRLARLPQAQRALMQRLYACDSLPQQKRLWQQCGDTAAWRWGLRLISMRWLWRYVFKEPGIAYVPRDFAIADYFHERFDTLMGHTPLREAFFAQMLAFGEVLNARALPPHLQPDGYRQVQAHVDRISLHVSGVDNFLAAHRGTAMTAFSLSDFGSYTDAETYGRIWRAVAGHGRHPKRICERQFLVKLDPQAMLRTWLTTQGLVLRRDGVLEEDLARCDRAFIYTFVCATVCER